MTSLPEKLFKEEVIAQSSFFIYWKLRVTPRWKAKVSIPKSVHLLFETNLHLCCFNSSHVEKEVSKYFKYFKSTSKILNGLLSSHRLHRPLRRCPTLQVSTVGFHPRRRPQVSSCPPEGAAPQGDRSRNLRASLYCKDSFQ
ncbi:uncharacterized protein LOC144066293 isoform X1 [Stigmatopora argus]